MEGSRVSERVALAGAAVATSLAAWLRLYHLDRQVPVDDEWHALHKLMSSGYGEIFSSFGVADHSIPLTLFYKLLAQAIGIDEIGLHVLQVVSGVALVAVASRLAWRATASAAVTVLLAFLLAGAPFLVLYSRFARPYAITTLLVVIGLAVLWRWRERRTRALGVATCALFALSAWLHPLTALYAMAALAYVLAEDVGERRARAARATFLLGVAVGLSILAFLAVSFVNDFGNLSGKAGRHVPDGYTLFRMASMFLGGMPDAMTVVMLLTALFGAWRFWREQRALGAYLAFAVLAPVLAVLVLGAQWTHQGHTFGRYVFPAQVLLLFWFAYGSVAIVDAIARREVMALEMAVAVAIAGGYLAYGPAIRQVRTLDAWYAHFYFHFDYVRAHNVLAEYWKDSPPPTFYRVLADLPRGTAPVIQAPFVFAAPVNRIAKYAQHHRQREYAGLLHDLCLEGPYYGEVPRDGRFRFRSLVFLDDPAAVRATGARYLLLHRDIVPGESFAAYDKCVAALKRLYGEPVDVDDRVTAFDLQAAAPRKLQ
jgi:hypothetical protein